MFRCFRCARGLPKEEVEASGALPSEPAAHEAIGSTGAAPHSELEEGHEAKQADELSEYFLHRYADGWQLDSTNYDRQLHGETDNINVWEHN